MLLFGTCDGQLYKVQSLLCRLGMANLMRSLWLTYLST